MVFFVYEQGKKMVTLYVNLSLPLFSPPEFWSINYWDKVDLIQLADKV